MQTEDRDAEGVALIKLGWNDGFAQGLPPELPADQLVGRVSAEHKLSYDLLTASGEHSAQVSGKLRHGADGRADFPAVGDWVLLSVPSLDQAVIHAVLPRKSKFSRKVAGALVEEQVIAANIDTVFIVCGLNRDFNLRRIERYLTLAWESGASPVIVLSKRDLCSEVELRVAEVAAAAPGVPVHAVSCLTDEGVDELAPYLGLGQTIALLGSSGAGKSTLINRLLGQELMQTGDIREGDDRGRHTTTHRQLLVVPSGALLIDTPGMRKLQLWGSDEGLQSAFDDIAQLALHCRFTDCSHTREPDCAVQAALRSGELDQERYESFRKLARELAHLARKENLQAALAEKQRIKAFGRQVKQRVNHKR